jgi:hypothetical protein
MHVYFSFVFAMHAGSYVTALVYKDWLHLRNTS